MRLDLGLIEASDVRFDSRTSFENRVLLINREELIRELEVEPLFETVEIELAHPRESCRIIRVLDVVEPRFRLNGPNFPGALEAMGLVGAGETRVLSNVAVIETSEGEARARSIIDMCGPATELSLIGAKHVVVLVPHPAAGADRNDFRLAVKKAGLRAATYLAAATRNTVPDATRSYELPAVAFNRGPEKLPRIAYIFPIHS